MRVAVVGGTGAVGRATARYLADKGHSVTIAGRSRTGSDQAGLTAARVDVATGQGLSAVMEDVDCVIHLASDPSRAEEVDVSGTARILDLIEGRHLIYLSIVGVDRHPLPYYRSKYAAESLIEDAGGRHTIVRATQFHDLIAYRVDRMTRWPIATVPRGYVYQPIEMQEVAAHLADLVKDGPQGRAPDLAGPEVLGIEHLARSYMAAKGIRRPLIRMPRFGRMAVAFRDGVHTNPDRAVGVITWADHLARRFGVAA